MRRTLIASAVLTLSLLVLPAKAEVWSVYGINGNDTGGIIPWSPALRAYGYRAAAQDHCAGYHKLAYITSVHPRYGDYVVFACKFPRDYDPVKQGSWWYGWPH
jgi:hypothetical protein